MSDRPPEIPTYVVSFGGCGSKLMTRLLYPSASPTFLERAHVHWRFPPSSSNGRSFVYMFGDPRNTVISFFQRRQSRHDRHGFLPSARAHEPQPDFVARAMRNLESPNTEIPEHWDLGEYLENARGDAFDLQGHFDQWRQFEEPDRLWFVNYEAFWSAPESIERHLGVARGEIPGRTPRRADWRNLNADHRQRMDALYGDFAESLGRLPLVFRADWEQSGKPGRY